MTLILPAQPSGWLHADDVPINEDILYRMIHIDEDRYSGCYSGAAYTAWPGVRPDDIDAGDTDCAKFWERHSKALHGRGNSPQDAYRDLVRKIEFEARWDVDVCLRVVMVEDFREGPTAIPYGSPEFREWLAQ